jgi:purine nucleoside permease
MKFAFKENSSVKKTVLCMLFAVLTAASGFAAGKAQDIQIPVKVLILPKFEIGEEFGDTAGEAQYYFEHYFRDAAKYTVKGVPRSLYVNRDGVAGIVTEMGKAQTSSTLTAVLSDTRFDFSKAYIISTGCAGSPPERTVLGDVVLGYEIVDRDLGHHLEKEDIEAGDPLFIRDNDYDTPGYTKLNSGLVEWAYNLTRDISLGDTERSRTVASLYGQDVRPPRVLLGTVLTSDNFGSGREGQRISELVVESYKTKYPYTIAEMEDAALGVVVKRFGMLDRFLVIRDSVNFDAPVPGTKIVDVFKTDWGIFPVARKNNFLVGQKIIDSLIAEKF